MLAISNALNRMIYDKLSLTEISNLLENLNLGKTKTTQVFASVRKKVSKPIGSCTVFLYGRSYRNRNSEKKKFFNEVTRQY